MKIVLGILIAFAVLICLLLLLRIGVSVLLEESGPIVRVAAGPLRIRVFPRAEGAPPAHGKKKKKPKKKEDAEKKKKPALRPGIPDLIEAAKQILPGVFRMIGRFFKSIRIDPMMLSIAFSGLSDPADTALLCGRVQELIWTLCPLLEKAVDLPDPHIHTGIDFLAEKPLITGRVDVTARVGALLGAALCALVPAIKWYLAWRRRAKREQKAALQNEKKQKTAADTQAAA